MDMYIYGTQTVVVYSYTFTNKVFVCVCGLDSCSKHELESLSLFSCGFGFLCCCVAFLGINGMLVYTNKRVVRLGLSLQEALAVTL